MSRYIDGLFVFDHEIGAREQRRTQEELVRPGLSAGDVAGAAYRQEMMMDSIYQRAVAPENRPDPSYVVDSDEWNRLTKGVPDEYHSAFITVANREHADWVRSQIDREVADKETLGRAGGWGMAASMAAGVLDPISLAVSAAFGPMGAANKIGRVSRFLHGGASAAVSNAVVEAGLQQLQVTRDPSQIAGAAAFGFALGGGLSALSRGDNVKLMDRAMAAHDLTEIDALRRAGLPISDEGVAALRRHAGVPEKPPVVSLAAQIDAGVARAAPVDAMAPVRAATAQQGFLARLESAPEAAPVARAESAEIAGILTPTVHEPKAPTESAVKAAFSKAVAEREVAAAERNTEIMGLLRSAAKESAWKRAEADKAKTEALAYAQREQQIAAAGGTPVERAVESEGFLSGSAGSAQIGMVNPEKTLMDRVRFDIFGRLKQSSSRAVRTLNRLVHGDAVGLRAGEGAQAITATEWASMTYKSSLAQARVAMDDAYGEWAKGQKLSMGDRFWQVKQEEFYTRASNAVWGAAENDPHVLAAAKAWRDLAARQLDAMKKTGVEGAEEVKHDANYLARLPNHERFSMMMTNYGRSNMVALVEGAMRARGTDMPDDKIGRIAAHYVTVRQALPYSEDLGRVYHGERDFAALRQLLAADEFGIKEADMDDLISALVDLTRDAETGAGKPARLKPKTALDETFSMRMKNTQTGADEVVRIADIWETDLRNVTQRYAKQTSGLIGYAKVGIKSTADWNRWKKQIADEYTQGGGDRIEMKDALRMFDLTRKHTLGMPVETEPMGNFARTMKVIRDSNFVRLMGQVGFAQIADIGNYLGAAGTRSFFHHMPALADIRRAVINGKPADSVLHRQLMSFIGVGGDAANAHAIMRSLQENEFYKPRTKLEQGVSRARDFTAKLSGLEAINLVMKQHGEVAMLQRMIDMSVKRVELNPKILHRLETDGLAGDMLDRVLAGLKKHSTRDADDFVQEFDWTKWQRDDGDAVDAFRMALYRQVNRAIQEPSVGETAWWMHTTMGKVLTQFRSFMLTSWAKQTLHGINHFDQTTVAMWGMSTMLAAFAYTVQNSINFAGNKEELEKRLSMEKIMLSGFQRAGFSSIIPMMIDTGADLTTGGPIFGYGRSTGLASGAIQGVPSIDAGLRLYSGLRAAGRSALTEHSATSGEVKSALGLVTPNLLLIRNLVDSASREFPESN